MQYLPVILFYFWLATIFREEYDKIDENRGDGLFFESCSF
jgi:hypothetical protein